jgi:hypothetical protein
LHKTQGVANSISGLSIGKGRGDGRGEVDEFVLVQPAFAAGEGEQGLDQACLLIAEGEYLRASWCWSWVS